MQSQLKSNRRKPTLDSLSTIDEHGTRLFLHPADVRGFFTHWRRLAALLLLVIYVALPWIPINGHPAVFMDVANQRFHFFGFTFSAQDVWLLFFVITGLAFSLFYVTALFGRVWCGWACPYTVFLEHLYRRVERIIDGDATARRKLDAAPLTLKKAGRRVLKHSIYIFLSAAIAHIFLSYFVSIPRLYEMMQGSPLENLKSFGIVLFFTVTLYFCFAWFREQFCIILCPYGRIQSALTDENTMVVGYDDKRGEPRGKASDPKNGDCIDCYRCVQVCPTGIDIRNGLQIECIGCSACIDACDEIMTRVKRPKGLIRYDSEEGLKGNKTKWIRTRTVVYTGLLVLGLVVMTFSLSQITPLEAGVVRLKGNPYYIMEETVQNRFQIRVINKTADVAEVKILLKDAPDYVSLAGAEGVQELEPMDERMITTLVEVPKTQFEGSFDFKFSVRNAEDKEVAEAKAGFIGPNPELLKAELEKEEP